MKRATGKTASEDTAAQKPSRRRYELIDRSTPGRKLLEFPEMKGRVVEKIEFFSTAEFHSVNLFFADKTSLVVGIEPGFEVHVDLESAQSGEPQITKRWPPIRSER
jgi:hypothetical protein